MQSDVSVKLKPALIFEWRGPKTSSSKFAECQGIEVVVAGKSFYAFIPDRAEIEKVPLKFTVKDRTEECSLHALIFPEAEIRTVQLFAKVIENKKDTTHSLISIDIPQDLTKGNYSVCIASCNGEFKATVDPKTVPDVLNRAIFCVFDAMHGSLDGFLANRPRANYQHAIMAPAFTRCIEYYFGPKGVNSLIQKLGPFLPILNQVGDRACPPVIGICYQFIGKEKMRDLMTLLMDTSYSGEMLQEIKSIFPPVFSFFASVFDPTERTEANLFRQRAALLIRVFQMYQAHSEEVN